MLTASSRPEPPSGPTDPGCSSPSPAPAPSRALLVRWFASSPDCCVPEVFIFRTVRPTSSTLELSREMALGTGGTGRKEAVAVVVLVVRVDWQHVMREARPRTGGDRAKQKNDKKNAGRLRRRCFRMAISRPPSESMWRVRTVSAADELYFASTRH